jgi:hypothetical protein
MINLQQINISNISITWQQAQNLKRAIRTGNWHNLKTWKEKYLFQVLCGDKEVIIAIGQEAKKL